MTKEDPEFGYPQEEAKFSAADTNCFGKGPIKTVKFFTGAHNVDPCEWAE
jgi:hypothetical protein